jgi:hypothetical protein
MCKVMWLDLRHIYARHALSSFEPHVRTGALGRRAVALSNESSGSPDQTPPDTAPTHRDRICGAGDERGEGKITLAKIDVQNERETYLGAVLTGQCIPLLL